MHGTTAPMVRWLALLAIVVGCGGPIDVESDAGTDPTDGGSEVDSGSDPVDGGAADARVDAVALEFTSPSGEPSYVSTNVTFQIFVTGSPERVELYRDDAPFSVLAAPYSLPWDVSTEDDGTFVFEARAYAGGSVVATAQRTIVLDREGPQITSITPAEGDLLSVDGVIVVAFSESIREASIAGAITIEQGAPRTFTTTLDASGRSLTIDPEGLAVEVPVVLTISPTITDLARNALAVEETRSWAVPAWTNLPELVGSTDGAAVAVDASGAPIVARLLSEDGIAARIEVERWDGGAWVRLGGSAMPVGLGSRPDLRMRSDGALFLGWARNPDSAVQVSRWTGTAWEHLGGAPAIASSDAKLAFDGVDAVFVTAGADVLRWNAADGIWSVITVPSSYTSTWLVGLEHANGRLVVAQESSDGSCAIRTVEPDGTSYPYAEIVGDTLYRCGAAVVGLHGTAGATASIFHAVRSGGGSWLSGGNRIWIDAPFVLDEPVYPLFVTTPSGYAGVLAGIGRVDVDGTPLPGSIPNSTFDAAHGGGVLAMLSTTATGYAVSTQRISAP